MWPDSGVTTGRVQSFPVKSFSGGATNVSAAFPIITGPFLLLFVLLDPVVQLRQEQEDEDKEEEEEYAV